MNSDETPIDPNIEPDDTPAPPGEIKDDTPTPEPTRELADSSGAGEEKQTDEVRAEADKELTGALQGHLQLLVALQNPLTEQQEVELHELGKSLPETILQVSRNKSAGLSGELLTLARLVKAVTLLQERQQMLDDCLVEISRLSPRNTAEIVNAQKLVRRLKSEIGWPQDAPVAQAYSRLLDAEQALEEIVISNREFQSGLLTATNELVTNLRLALESGNSTEAGAIWDKIQGNIGNLSGRTQHELKEQISELRTQVNELREWKKFAAAEKKKELIGEMQVLCDTSLQPPQRAARIRKLHENWKQLGYSEQNEELWQQFKEISDRAYAPCKEFYQQRKAVMAENLKQRNGICERVEAFLETVNREAPKLAELRDFEKQAQEDWKKYAPIEQSKIKTIQKRFYGLLDKVREIRRTTAKANGALKQALVGKARQLQELEDRRDAMEQAKALQAEWKTIGPAQFRDDRRYWEEFRAACDALFRDRDEAKKAARSASENTLQASTDILKRLESLLEQNDEELRESRKLFDSLQRDFHQTLNPRIRKDSRQLQDHFTVLTRKIEARFRRLPDKKQLAALAALEARSSQCLALEKQLLSCSDDQSMRNILDSFNRDAWNQLQTSGIPGCDRQMDLRIEMLLGLSGLDAFQKPLQDCEQQARRQLVEAEIRAHLDSPELDRPLRMELQLSQLQNSFGRASLDESGDRQRFGREFQLQQLCTGPLSEPMRGEFQQRVERILDKLL